MTIFYLNKTYSLKELTDLEHDAPFFSEGISFIRDWVNQQEHFEFQSSGSTGTPKKITISRKQILSSVALTREFLDLRSREKALVCLDAAYVATKMMLARCLVVDMDVVLIPPMSNPLEQLATPVDFASFVPLQIEAMLQANQTKQLSSIKNVLIGGAPLEADIASAIHSLPNNIYLTYGMTETVSHVALRLLSKDSTTRNFTTLKGITIGTNSEGCLTIKGSVTDQQLLETTDLVEIKSETAFCWLGRKDNIINSGGIKLVPEQIETELHPILHQSHIPEDFFVAGMPDASLGQKLTLFLEAEKITADQENELITRCKKTLPKYHVPKMVICLKSFTRTPSGKINRKETIAQLSGTSLRTDG